MNAPTSLLQPFSPVFKGDELQCVWCDKEPEQVKGDLIQFEARPDPNFGAENAKGTEW